MVDIDVSNVAKKNVNIEEHMEFNVIKNHVVSYVINGAFAWCKYQLKNTSNLSSMLLNMII